MSTASAAAGPAAPCPSPGVLKHSYVFWNNKGGVGKTTLCFHVASQFAECNPLTNVLVLDMCPQASVSLTLLTKYVHRINQYVPGSEAVGKLADGKLQKNIVGYLVKRVLANDRSTAASDFVVQVREYNPNVAHNMYLCCGDKFLDLIAPQLEHARSADPLPSYGHPWKRVTTAMKVFISELVATRGGEWMVFIDTNPAFSIYTEIAIAAADRVLIPFNPDDYSRYGAEGLFSLLYGLKIDSPLYKSFENRLFCCLAQRHGVEVPKVHLLINNRALVRKSRATAAFAGLSKENTHSIYKLYKTHRAHFVVPDYLPVDITEEDFTCHYVKSLQEFHGTGVVATHFGTPFLHLQRSKYCIADQCAKLQKKPIDDCIEGIQEIVKRL